MTKLPPLSRNEWLLMNLCWKRELFPARDICEDAQNKRNWEYQPVKTMLDRLSAKGYLRRGRFGSLCAYAPAVPRSKVIADAVEGFVHEVLDNTVAPLVAHLARKQDLSDEELALLKKIVEEREEDSDGRDT